MWNKLFYNLKRLNRQLNFSLGYVIIALGIIIVVMYIPSWLWMVFLGTAIIMAGYYINIYFR